MQFLFQANRLSGPHHRQQGYLCRRKQDDTDSGVEDPQKLSQCSAIPRVNLISPALPTECIRVHRTTLLNDTEWS